MIGAPSRLAPKVKTKPATESLVEAAPDLYRALKAIVNDPLARLPSYLAGSAVIAIRKAEGRA